MVWSDLILNLMRYEILTRTDLTSQHCHHTSLKKKFRQKVRNIEIHKFTLPKTKTRSKKKKNRVQVLKKCISFQVETKTARPRIHPTYLA